MATKIGDNIWKWEVFLQGSDSTLSQVECVDYYLDSSFQPPKWTVCQKGVPDRAFPLEKTGWGTFTIDIHIRFKNGQSKDYKHQLVF